MIKKYIVIVVIALLSINSNAQTVSDLYAKHDSSVVVIRTIESKTKGQGIASDKVSYGALGSGVLISKDGTILTAAHVVNNADEIEVVFIDGQVMKAKIQGLSRIADVAVIKTMGLIKDPKPSKMGDSDKSRIGDKVMIIGSPMGLEHSLSVGYISRKETQHGHSSNFKKMEFFQTDAAINTGNSGGPMFNMDGEVIGVVSSILSRSGGFEGIGFVATINIIKELLIDQSNNWIGVEVFYLYGPLAMAFNVPQDGAVLIENVAKNSPAYFMGLKGGFANISIEKQDIVIGGDIVLAIDDMKFDNPDNVEDAVKYLNSLEKGKSYIFKILRAGKIIDLKWTVR